MPITRVKKEETVAKLKERIQRSNSLLLAKFHGLSVTKISDLRRKFRKDDADYTVAKKTLIKIAFRDEGKEIKEDLEGEVSVISAYGDPLAIFKTASDFAKKEKEGFHILGGFFDSKLIDAAQAKALGAIPSREVLLAQLMSVIVGNTRKFVFVVDQIRKQKSQ